MKLSRSILVTNLIFSLVFVSFLSLAIQNVSAQDSRIALQRGYRAGYSDGYMFGYRDIIDNAAKSYDRHSDYTKADRAFNKSYGSLEDYSDGYRQGFEIGYDTGFEKRAFDATLPTDLKKRGQITNTTAVITPIETKVEEQTPTVAETTTAITEPSAPQTKVEEPIVADTPTETVTETAKQPPIIPTKYENVTAEKRSDALVTIPVDTELIVELLGDINTERSKEGDKFTARVISPYEFSGAVIEGRISKIQKPGRIKRRSELLLSFDRIVLTDNRWGNFNALLTEVLPIKGDNVSRVDVEGTVEGRGSIKDDSIKVGAATGTGLIVGAITGGPVGAAVGAGVGAAFGVGAVVVERGKHIRLKKDQQLRIRSAYETQIR